VGDASPVSPAVATPLIIKRRSEKCTLKQRKSASQFYSATVCKTVRPVLSDRCLSVLSVTLVYCGQTVGSLEMKLGMEIGLVLADAYLRAVSS